MKKKPAIGPQFQAYDVYAHELAFMDAIKTACEKPGRCVEDVVSAGCFQSLATGHISGRTLKDVKGSHGKKNQVAATLWIFVERLEPKRASRNRQTAPKKRRATGRVVSRAKGS